MAAKVGFSYLCPQGVVELYSKIADQGYTIMFLTNRWKPKLPKVFNINFKVQGYRSVWDDGRLYQVVVRGKIQNASGTSASPGFQIAPRSYCGSWSPYQSFCWVSAEWNIKGGISVGSPWDRAAERTTGGEQDCGSQVWPQFVFGVKTWIQTMTPSDQNPQPRKRALPWAGTFLGRLWKQGLGHSCLQGTHCVL